MKRAIMVHGWDGFPENHWFPWVKRELEKLNFKVIIPKMPNPSQPKIKEWVSYLEKIVGKLDSESYFIGHSLGCQAILRYLEQEEINFKIPLAVLVAGWFRLNNLETKEAEKIAQPWLETPFNFDRIKNKIQNLTVILSDNEPYGFVSENARLFREKLGATIMIEKNKGHFTRENGITEIPEVVSLFGKYLKI